MIIKDVNPKGKPNNIPSSLSKMPPWPGKIFPVFLILAFLFKKEKNKSPSRFAMEVITPIIMIFISKLAVK